MNVKQNEKQFKYLYGLQKSGRTNMFLAAPFLQRAMRLTKKESEEILIYWMDNYESVAKELDVEI
jgi:hypothetical protein